MIDVSKSRLVADFLEGYPKQHWPKCIESVLLIGIETLKLKYSTKPSIEHLVDFAKRPRELSIREELDHMKHEIENLHPCIKHVTERPQRRNLPSSSRSTPKRPPQGISNFKTKAREVRQPSPKEHSLRNTSSERKIPKYLQNIQSVIGKSVAKDIAKHRNTSYHEEQLDSDFQGKPIGPYDRQSSLKYEGYGEETERTLSASRREPLKQHTQACKRQERTSKGNVFENRASNFESELLQPRMPEQEATLALIHSTERENYEERYNLPRQIPSKTPPRPPQIKSTFVEPKTCEISEVSHLLSRTKVEPRQTDACETGDLLRIAEQFLTDPYMNQLYRSDSRLSIPSSPRNLEQWLSTKERLFGV